MVKEINYTCGSHFRMFINAARDEAALRVTFSDALSSASRSRHVRSADFSKPEVPGRFLPAIFTGVKKRFDYLQYIV